MGEGNKNCLGSSRYLTLGTRKSRLIHRTGGRKIGQFLIAVLDKNQLYVNYSEIDDVDYQISNEDKELNRQFYGG